MDQSKKINSYFDRIVQDQTRKRRTYTRKKEFKPINVQTCRFRLLLKTETGLKPWYPSYDYTKLSSSGLYLKDESTGFSNLLELLSDKMTVGHYNFKNKTLEKVVLASIFANITDAFPNNLSTSPDMFGYMVACAPKSIDNLHLDKDLITFQTKYYSWFKNQGNFATKLDPDVPHIQFNYKRIVKK